MCSHINALTAFIIRFYLAPNIRHYTAYKKQVKIAVKRLTTLDIEMLIAYFCGYRRSLERVEQKLLELLQQQRQQERGDHSGVCCIRLFQSLHIDHQN